MMVQQFSRLLLGFILVLLTCSATSAKSVVIDRRFVVDSSQVKAHFFQNEGDPFTFQIAWGGIMLGNRFTYECANVDWDWGKVRDASSNLAELLNNGSDIVLLEFLEAQGFDGCKWTGRVTP